MASDKDDEIFELGRRAGFDEGWKAAIVQVVDVLNKCFTEIEYVVDDQKKALSQKLGEIIRGKV